MLIQREIKEFLILSQESVKAALRKISQNRARAIVTVDENGVLEGVITDGDIRRWITSEVEIDLNKEARILSNSNCLWLRDDVNPAELDSTFRSGIDLIPLLDRRRRVVAIAFNKQYQVVINERVISDTNPAYIIAEIGNNHNGDIVRAKELVALAAEAGVDSVKFQLRDMESLYGKDYRRQKASCDLGAEYTFDLLEKYNLKPDQLFEIFDYCKNMNVEPLCTPWDLESVERLREYGVNAYKVASADLTNDILLEKLIETHRPLICSTGMSREYEIATTARKIRHSGVPFALLHCNSTYPAPFKDINLKYIHRLKELSGGIVGYSGHERDIFISVAAVTLGAKIIEKHFTVDRSLEGNDHKVSLLPEELNRMVEGIRQVESSLDGSESREMSQGEMMNREILAKSIVAAENIEAGNIITREKLTIRSPGTGLQPNRMEELVGTPAIRKLGAGDIFYSSDLRGPNELVLKKKFNFKRQWGFPVRFHDFNELVSDTNPGLVEFHLSYRDLEVDYTKLLPPNSDLEFVVHAPELFSSDHILNLCDDDCAYRHESIQSLQRVVNLTKKLRDIFPKTQAPRIVTNVGGFSTKSFVSNDKKRELYSLLNESLQQLNLDGVVLLPQTMPPFPWHFGGQQFHNLFVDADSIYEFCTNNQIAICLDLSHTMLACNYFKWSFESFARKVGKFVSHLHISDYQGVDGEGLPIGDGELNVDVVSEVLRAYMPQASFIPEIWQGHKNGGELQWRALHQLESIL